MVKFKLPPCGASVSRRTSGRTITSQFRPPNAVGYLPALEANRCHFKHQLRIIQIRFPILWLPHSGILIKQFVIPDLGYRSSIGPIAETVRFGCIGKNCNAWMQCGRACAIQRINLPDLHPSQLSYVNSGGLRCCHRVRKANGERFEIAPTLCVQTDARTIVD